MRKIAALSSALVLSAGACGSPEATQSIPVTVEAVTPAIATEPLTTTETTEAVSPAVTQSAELLSATAMQELFDVRLDAVHQQYPDTITELQIVSEGDSTTCAIDDSLHFTVEGSDPAVAYNCLGDKTIVVAASFIDRHLKTNSDHEAAAGIVLAHEIGHSIMDDLGINPITTDKANGERMADCLAGNSFSSLTPEEKFHLESVFSETIRPVSDDIAGREAAFASGLDAEICNL